MDNAKNFAKVTVSAGYDAAATSIALTSGHAARLPTPPFNATWWNSTDFPDPSDDSNVEIVRVTAIVGDTLTVTRAQESTSASTKNTASKTYRMVAGLTAKVINTDLGTAFAQALQGRLTLESGVPISSTDQTAKTTIYFTPFKGNVISLYDGTNWSAYSFNELSLALGTLVANTNYDVFIYSNAGTPTLELSAAWATASTRTDALAFQNGIYVKSGAATRRYLGTFRTTTTTTTEDSQSKRLLWNYDNQFVRRAFLDTGGTPHTYTGTWRMYNGNAANKIDVVVGMPVVANISFTASILDGSTNPTFVGVGINSTTDPTGSFAATPAGAPGEQGIWASPWALALGHSTVNLVEIGTGVPSFSSGSLTVALFN